MQVFDGTVDKDTCGVVAGCVSREKGIRASRKDEDIVWNCLARGAGDEFVLGMDLGDLRIEVVVEGAQWTGRIL